VATKVIMPKQGLQMTEGIITKWLVREGEKIDEGKPLFEMETDKLTIGIDSPASGTLLKIIRVEGDIVPITETIAMIGLPGEDVSLYFAPSVGDEPSVGSDAGGAALKKEENASLGARAQTNGGGRNFITPRAKKAASDKGLDIEAVKGSGPNGLIIEKDVLDFKANKSEAPKLTPVAKKIADACDVSLDGVKGSGARGKIMKADIEALISARDGKGAPEDRKGRVIPFAGMRKIISQKMLQSLGEMAQANHRMKVDMTEVVRLRERLKAEGIKVSFTDILVKVVSRALTEFPICNSSLTEEGILLKDYVNMGIAVAVENGLIVPVIKDADLMTLKEISTASGSLFEKAKKGGLLPDDYTGGSFTITNLGMFDIDEFTAIINPPESAILAVGKIQKTPVVENDSVVIRPVMVLSLTYDHRIIDGAPAAQFLQRIKQILQNPYLLI